MSNFTTVAVGNFDAVEERFDQDQGRLALIPVEPRKERVTTFRLVPGTIMQQASQVIEGLKKMMAEGARPWWIESSDDALGTSLRQHFGLTEGASSRPTNWGDGTTTTPKDQQGG